LADEHFILARTVAFVYRNCSHCFAAENEGGGGVFMEKTMTRYFYTDPMKAACMAKWFGMKLQDCETSDEGRVYDVTFDLMLEGGDFDRPLARYYYPGN
jgi:hypothetical protein